MVVFEQFAACVTFASAFQTDPSRCKVEVAIISEACSAIVLGQKDAMLSPSAACEVRWLCKKRGLSNLKLKIE